MGTPGRLFTRTIGALSEIPICCRDHELAEQEITVYAQLAESAGIQEGSANAHIAASTGARAVIGALVSTLRLFSATSSAPNQY